MIRIHARGATYGELWHDEPLPADPGVDVLVFRSRPGGLTPEGAAPCLTLVTDLLPDEPALFARFGKDCRYKIRRAEERDILLARFMTEPAGWLVPFNAFFDAFARESGLPPADRAWLDSAARARQLALSAASCHGEMLVWHAYGMAGNTVWLQYTASAFRNRDADTRALVGRANRWLHWQDIRRFKAMGFARYDWGGMFADESTASQAGINRFKREFGGEPVKAYDGIAPVTLRGRMVLPLRDAWRRLRSAAGPVTG